MRVSHLVAVLGAFGLLAFAPIGVSIASDDPTTPKQGDPKAEAPSKETQALVARAEAHRDGRRYSEAVEDYTKALEQLRLRHPGSAHVASVLSSLAVVYSGLNRQSEALQAGEEGLALFRTLMPGDSLHVPVILITLGRTLLALGRPQEALPRHQEAVEMCRRLYSDDHPDFATAANRLAETYQAMGQPKNALLLHLEVLAMRRRLYPGDHPVVAKSLHDLAVTQLTLGRPNEALAAQAEAIAMYRRMSVGDDAGLASSLHQLATTHEELGRLEGALTLYKEALAMHRRVFHADHHWIAASLSGLVRTYLRLGRPHEALPLQEQALDMVKRAFKGDHGSVASALNTMSATLEALGRTGEALLLAQETLAMLRRLFPGDHPNIAISLGQVATNLGALGRRAEATPLLEEAHAMDKRMFQSDHPGVALGLVNLAANYRATGRAREALPRFKEALAMFRRLFPADHPHVATTLTMLAGTYTELGRVSDALPIVEEALAIQRRLFADDHPDVAASLAALGNLYYLLGRFEESRPVGEKALAIARRLHSGDNRHVALYMSDLALTYDKLDRANDAVALLRESLEMRRRIYPGAHSNVATSLSNLASVLIGLERPRDALPLQNEAVAMLKRQFPDGHPNVALVLYNLSFTLGRLGRDEEQLLAIKESIQLGDEAGWHEVHRSRTELARLHLRNGNAQGAVAALVPAVAQIELRRREAASLGTEGRAQFAGTLRESGPYALLVRARVLLGQSALAFDTLEQARGREMLDLLEQGRDDPLQHEMEIAKDSGDMARHLALQGVHDAVKAAEAHVVAMTRDVEQARASGKRAEQRAARQAMRKAHAGLKVALRKRLHALQDALPGGRPLRTSEVQARLAPGERLLAYALGIDHSFVFVVSRDAVHVAPLASEHMTRRHVSTSVADYLSVLTNADAAVAEKNKHAAELFRHLVPGDIWGQIKGATRLYVLPHGALHRIPFEALVVREHEGQPVYWVDDGPPIAYAVSASVLGWLHARTPSQPGSGKIVAVADPAFDGAAQWPATGVLITDVAPNSQAERLALRQGDIITAYAGKHVAMFKDLLQAMKGVDPTAKEFVVEYEREGVSRTVTAQPGRLGVNLSPDAPSVAGPNLLTRARVGTITRSAAMRGRLSPLPGTRREVAKIQEALKAVGKQGVLQTLIGEAATERALFDASNSPRILHLGTHGLVNPRLGARASALALTPPRLPVAENDGFLTLGDLLERWRSRLDGTELVVLSACESQTGSLDTNEGMFALPWGFCFAGARSSIASLWPVDDQSTATLMAHLYRGLLAGDKLNACESLRAALLATKAEYPDPFHWAPFVLVGAP